MDMIPVLVVVKRIPSLISPFPISPEFVQLTFKLTNCSQC